MAHQYENFDEAWEAYSANWHTGYFYWDLTYDRASKAITYANQGNWQMGIKYCAYAIKMLADVVNDFVDCQWDDIEKSRMAESIYWAAQQGGDGELDMSAILNAMWESESHQPLLFIATIDAMRTSIFDKTIDIPTFAGYVRHFQR